VIISNERPVLTTDSTDGHRWDRTQIENASYLCPSVKVCCLSLGASWTLSKHLQDRLKRWNPWLKQLRPAENVKNRFPGVKMLISAELSRSSAAECRATVPDKTTLNLAAVFRRR
jgi:hypothetical protein